MLELGTFEDARRRVLSNAERMLLGVKRVVAEPIDSVEGGIALLSSVRKQAHEHLNQIQHEQMIVCAAEWLLQHGVATAATRWLWNPRHGADHAAPGLLGKEGDTVRVCAEVNALEEPVGVIDAQMRRGLARLAAIEGRRFYFVRTASMKRRAVTKVVKTGWDIAVVQLSLRSAGPTLALGAPLTSLAVAPHDSQP
ncbi:MAG TPA: hypothetical protein VMK32_10170 [Burkholderiaceae bacterium]|nr:hypothetical protein [Burkholderiaceae bacterium]